MEPTAKLPPVKKKTKLDPIDPDIFRKSQSNFASLDNSKAIQSLMEENEQLKNELEIARKEIFRLKEENTQLKLEWKGKVATKTTTFLTSSTSVGQNGGSTQEDTKMDSDNIICHNWKNPIAKQNYKLHVIYWEKNLVEWSYWKQKLNRPDLNTHIEEERGTFDDLLEAISKNKISDIETMYEHGNDIFVLDSSDVSNNTLLHIAVMNGNRETAEFLIRKGIDVNSANANKETPLHHAVAIKNQKKAVEMVELMISKGADPYLKDNLGDTPVEKAKRLGKSDILMLFAETDDRRVATPSNLSFRIKKN